MKPRKRKRLKDYSDEELKEILEDNANTELLELAGICSEVLRRYWPKTEMENPKR